MTEVWEEKSKDGSMNIEDGEHRKQSQEKNVNKETTNEKEKIEGKTCQSCGRIFKNYRALKSHEGICKGKGKMKTKGKREEEKGEVSEEIEEEELPKLREKLLDEMEAIKEERKKLEQERHAFRAEMKKELERLSTEMRAEYKGSIDNEALDEEVTEILPQEGMEEAGPRGHPAPGVVVLEAEEEFEGKKSINEVEKELDRIEPEVAGIGKGVTLRELEELANELELIESDLNTKVDFAALTKMSEDYEVSIKQIEKSIGTVNRKIDDVIKEMDESAEKYGTYQNVVREIGKLDDRTIEILEEIGFGESLNVTKIPPNILESVYESTIEGTVNEINRNYGSHDAENIISRTLEDIRTRTSGSELFYFDGRMLKTRNLAKAIEQKLISAKQVQTTYDELLSKLMEYLPGYKAKNFRAMIKLKSQEYAVDKSTLLLESIEVLREHIDNLKNMVGSVSNRQNTIEIEINRLSESKVGKDDIEHINALLEEIKVKQGDLDEMLKGIKDGQTAERNAFSEELKSISKRLEELETSGLEKKKKETVKPPKKKEKKKEDKKITPPGVEVELSEDENRILTMVPSKGHTLSRIKKELADDITEKKIKECLQSMIHKGIISTVKRGKHTIYVRVKKGNGGEE
jgi:hypothetical protein